jgi:hypothetical protein
MVTRQVSEDRHSASPPSREGRGQAECDENPRSMMCEIQDASEAMRGTHLSSLTRRGSISPRLRVGFP